MKRYLICINDTFCLILNQNNLIYLQISREIGYFDGQNILNLSKNRLKYCVMNESYNMYHIAKVSIQPIYQDTIQSPSMNGFIVHCSRYLFCFHIFNQ